MISIATLSSCKKDEPGGNIGETKPLNWELFHDTEIAFGFVASFAVSDDAKWLFYSDSERRVFRVNKTTGEKKTLLAPYDRSALSFVHFINGKLYLIYEENYESYVGISNDLGETFTPYRVGTYTHFAAGQFTGAFVRVTVNRLFLLPGGDLIIPHIFRQPNDALSPADDKQIAVSQDGGATWARNSSEYSFISAQRGNRLYAISGGWQGDFNTGQSGKAYYSDDKGQTWHESDLKYTPQTVDRENNLIAGNAGEIQKLKNNTWTIYKWDAFKAPFVHVQPLRYFNQEKTMADIQFDAANNIYILSGEKRIYKSRLN